MTCPRCHSELEGEWSICPECGIALIRNVSGVMKTSAILIAAGSERGFYASVKDVPEPWRTQLLETTSSSNSGTIVIADRAGKEQLTQAIARRKANGAAAQPPDSGAPDATTSQGQRGFQWLAWAGFVLILITAVVIAALFYLHW